MNIPYKISCIWGSLEIPLLSLDTAQTQCSCAVPGLAWPGLCIVSEEWGADCNKFNRYESRPLSPSLSLTRHQWPDKCQSPLSVTCLMFSVLWWQVRWIRNQSESLLCDIHLVSLSRWESRHVLRCIVSTFFLAKERCVYSFHAFAERYMIIIVDS